MLSSPTTRPMTPAQLRRLQALWHRWAGALGLGRESDRKLRHYYVELFTQGRARKTRQLTRSDAANVISRLERLGLPPGHVEKRAAGTAGRRGFPERRCVPPGAAAWRALWGVARSLGMDRARLDSFIAARYAGVGLRGLQDVRTMADLNRVLWGLKAMLRRRPKRGRRPALKKVA